MKFTLKLTLSSCLINFIKPCKPKFFIILALAHPPGGENTRKTKKAFENTLNHLQYKFLSKKEIQMKILFYEVFLKQLHFHAKT